MSKIDAMIQRGEGIVYMTTNLVNGKRYIGSHCGDPDSNYLGSGINLTHAIKKYGKENFERVVLYHGIGFREYEGFILAELDCANDDDYYNLTNDVYAGGPEHTLFKNGHEPWNKGTKGVMVPWNKGKTDIYSDETRKKMSEAKKKAGIRPPCRKGAKQPERSAEYRKKQSNAWTPERRAAASERMKKNNPNRRNNDATTIS